MIVKDKEDIKTGYSYRAFRNIYDIDFKEIGKEAVDRAISKLGAKPIKSGNYQTVLKNTVFANLLESYVSIFSADQAQKDFLY